MTSTRESDVTSRKSTQYNPLNTDLTFENQSKIDSSYKLEVFLF